MSDSDGILGPLRRALRPAGDKTKVDEGDFSAVQMGNEVGEEASVETPAMNQHETHVRLLYIALARRGTSSSASASNRRSMSDSSCVAVKATRSLAVPAGTVGGLMATAQKPALRRRALMARAASGASTTTGTICVVDAPVLSPSAPAP